VAVGDGAIDGGGVGVEDALAAGMAAVFDEGGVAAGARGGVGGAISVRVRGGASVGAPADVDAGGAVAGISSRSVPGGITAAMGSVGGADGAGTGICAVVGADVAGVPVWCGGVIPRGGVVVDTVRGGIVDTPRGGVVVETVRGGIVDTPRGGVVVETLRGGLVGARGCAFVAPSGDTILVIGEPGLVGVCGTFNPSGMPRIVGTFIGASCAPIGGIVTRPVWRAVSLPLYGWT
jgi:hypothetical protein